jgi:hypothetical protein
MAKTSVAKNKRKVRFDDPQRGWIEFTISYGETTVKIVAEHSPRDSFLELVNALCNFRFSDGESIVRWQYNPIELDMLFVKQGAKVSLDIVRYPDHRRLEGRGEFMFSINGTYSEVCQPFWRALRDLQTRFSSEEMNSRWCRVFPSGEIDVLTIAIKDKKKLDTSALT